MSNIDPSQTTSPTAQITTRPSGRKRLSVSAPGDGVDAAHKPTKRRASGACESCRELKLKCNATEDGTPCANCRLSRRACSGAVNNRQRKRRGSEWPQVNRLTSNSSDTDSFEITPLHGTCDPHTNGYGSTANRNSPGALQPNPLDQCEDTIRAGPQTQIWANAAWGSWHPPKRAALELPSFVRPLTLPIPDAEYEFLLMKGAFWLPSADVMLELLNVYFQFVHPFMPFLEKSDLFEACLSHAGKSQGDTECADVEKISLLTLNAALFAGSAYAEESTLKAMGYGSHETVRKSFYDRTRLLYDFDIEPDTVSVLQVLLLLTYWYVVPDIRKSTAFWNGAAVTLAQSIDLPREAEKVAFTNQKYARMLRRLWWSCFMRDTLVALGLRQPPIMKIEECNMTLVKVEDFNVPYGVTAEGQGRSHPQNAEATKEHSLATIFVEMAKLCITLNRILSVYSVRGGIVVSPTRTATASRLTERDSSADVYVQVLSECAVHLEEWLQNLPEEYKYQQRSPIDGGGWDVSVKVHTILLNMKYYAAINALYFPQILQASTLQNKQKKSHILFAQPGIGGRTLAQNMVQTASLRITAIAEALIVNHLTSYLPNSTFTFLLPAIAIHLLDIKTGESAKRETAHRALGVCIKVIQALNGKYQTARQTVRSIEVSLSKSGLQLDHPESFGTTDRHTSQSLRGHQPWTPQDVDLTEQAQAQQAQAQLASISSRVRLDVLTLTPPAGDGGPDYIAQMTYHDEMIDLSPVHHEGMPLLTEPAIYTLPSPMAGMQDATFTDGGAAQAMNSQETSIDKTATGSYDTDIVTALLDQCFFDELFPQFHNTNSFSPFAGWVGDDQNTNVLQGGH